MNLKYKNLATLTMRHTVGLVYGMGLSEREIVAIAKGSVKMCDEYTDEREALRYALKKCRQDTIGDDSTLAKRIRMHVNSVLGENNV